MKKNIFWSVLTIVTTLLFAQNVSCQYDDFDLSEYKLPYLKRQQLDLSFNLNPRSNSQTSDNIDNLTNQNYKSKYSNRYLYYNFNASYNYFLNSNKYQGNQNITLNSSLDNTKIKEPYDNYKYSYFNSDLKINSNNRFYNGLHFIEVDFSGGVEFDSYQRKNYNTDNSPVSDYKTYSPAVSVSVPVYIGTGRIEPVQDARQAIYIFDELLKNGRLKSTPGKEEILKFARRISEIKNKRFFDSRLRTIYEISAIDSFLQSNGLVTDADALYFTTLNDYWMNTGSIIRYSGTRFSVGVKPVFYNNSQKITYHDTVNSTIIQTMENRDLNRTWSAAGTFRFNYEKPINLYWQNSLSANFDAGIENYLETDDIISGQIVPPQIKLKHQYPFVETVWSYKLGYYPNSRTYFNLNVSALYHREFGNEETNSPDMKYKVDDKYGSISPGFGCYYYVSQRFRIAVNYNYQFNYESNSRKSTSDSPTEIDYLQKQNNQNHAFTATLQYSLF